MIGIDEKYIDAMDEGTEWTQFPIYILISMLLGLYGMLFIFVASKHGIDPQAVADFSKLLMFAMWGLVLIPFWYGIAAVLIVWYRGDSE